MRKKETLQCDNMSETGGHHAKWSKPEWERQMLYALTYMWNLKIVELTETETTMVVSRGLELEEVGRWSKNINFHL